MSGLRFLVGKPLRRRSGVAVALALSAVLVVAGSCRTAGAQSWQWIGTETIGPSAGYGAASAIMPAKSYGPSFPSFDSPPADTDGRPSDITIQSFACIGGGTVGLAAAVATGSDNILSIIAGGVVPPLSTVAFYLGLGGVVFATYCTIAAGLTPMVRYLLRTEPADAPAAAH